MTTLIIQAKPELIDLWPETVEQEIIQNINTLLLTPKYSVPLGRDIGTQEAYVDKPLLQAQALIRSELFSIIPYYEPRVKVSSISFAEQRTDGDSSEKMATLIPRVKVVMI